MHQKHKITVVCENESPRLAYVLNFLTMSTDIHFHWKVWPEGTETISPLSGLTIRYSNKPVKGSFTVFCTGLLHETGIGVPYPGIMKDTENTFLYPAPPGFDLRHDIFSAIFYLISRYEEYLPFQGDRYGRFEADQSMAYKNGFLEEPVIDQWIALLLSAFEKHFPDFRPPRKPFRYLSTVDVDHPWAFSHRGLLWNIPRLLKSLFTAGTGDFLLRLRVMARMTPDPFDTYEYVLEASRRHSVPVVFFFLSGNSGSPDNNFALGKRSFTSLVHHLREKCSIGIHPSYASNRSLKTLKKEFERFSCILGKKPVISRQHYLIMRFPDTCRALIDQGIQDDYTMGYASRIGFRAGTTMPFRFYDLEREAETNLVLHPFICMDVTFRQYLGLTPEKASDMIRTMMNKVRLVHGRFVSLWHNESLSEYGLWKGWRKVYEDMLKMGGKITSDG